MQGAWWGTDNLTGGDCCVAQAEWLLDPRQSALSRCRKSGQWGQSRQSGSSLVKTNRGTWDRHTWEIRPLKIPSDSGAMKISSSIKCHI